MNKKIDFIENDIQGESTLDVIAKASTFNKWMYETIKPHCKKHVLEIGSGIGNISSFFLNDGFDITLSDIRSGYCDRLKNKFDNHPNLKGVELLDLVDPDFDNKYSEYFQKFDTIFALNVVEHIHDDVLALSNCKKMLAENGTLIILVPSYQKLFNQFDVELGHYRRYNKTSLGEIFRKSNFEIVHRQYFNFIGIFGWYISGQLMKKKTIPAGQMSLYNTLVPIFKIIDKLIFNAMGLSTIVVGKKS